MGVLAIVVGSNGGNCGSYCCSCSQFQTIIIVAADIVIIVVAIVFLIFIVGLRALRLLLIDFHYRFAVVVFRVCPSRYFTQIFVLIIFIHFLQFFFCKIVFFICTNRM